MWIKPEEAIQGAARGLASLRLDEQPELAAAVARGHAGTPQFVDRLDLTEQGYYLVPWEDERGVVVILHVDANTGDMTSMAALSEPRTSMLLTPSQALALVNNATSAPRLVWKPCRESASAFQPFYLVQSNDGDVFVRSDGVVYRELTGFLRGG